MLKQGYVIILFGIGFIMRQFCGLLRISFRQLLGKHQNSGFLHVLSLINQIWGRAIIHNQSHRSPNVAFDVWYILSFKIAIRSCRNQNSIQEEIKGRLKAGNSCYYSVQILLSSRLLSKNLKIKISSAHHQL